MANTNKSSLIASRSIPMVLQFLKENGFEEAFAALQIEASMEYTKVEPAKPSLLMEALTAWDELQSASDKKSQEVTPEQRADDALLASRIRLNGPPAAAELAVSLDGVHKMNVIAVRFSPDPTHQVVATGGADKLLKITNWKTSQVEASVACSGPVLSLDFHPNADSHLVLVGCMNNSHAVVDWKRGAIVQDFKDHSKYVCTVRWSGDGKHFVTASHDKSLNVYHAATDATTTDGSTAGSYALKRSFPYVGPVECAVWLRDNKTVLVGVRNDPYLHAVDVLTCTETGKYNVNARLDDHVSFTPLDLVLSPCGEFLAVPTDGHRIIVFRTLTTRQVRNLYGFVADGFSNPRVCWSHDSAFVYAISQGDHSIVCWEVSTGKVVHKMLGHTNTIRDLARHPTQELLATVAFDKSIKIWRPKGTTDTWTKIVPATPAAATATATAAAAAAAATPIATAANANGAATAAAAKN